MLRWGVGVAVSRPLTTLERAKDARLRREYGITLSEYKRVLRGQGGCCAICKRPEKEFKNALAVDHDHVSGKLRGLLCWGCNKALGVFRDHIENMKEAVQYLLTPPMTKYLGREVITAPGKVGSKRRAKLLRALKIQEEKNGKRKH
jgi:hypothetical protein